jgi:murein DD-endopeptidase MepM/ murein hydrolase activator NlpD
MGKANMKTARAAAEALSGNKDIWKPDPGVHFVRVIEPIGEMGSNFFTGYALHWGFGDPVPCPRRMFGGACPICLQGQRLPEAEAQKYWPGMSAYMNILIVDEDGDPVPNAEGEAQVKVWRVGKDTLNKIFNAIERESPSVDELIDITDSEHGTDLRVKRTGKTKDDTDWDISCARHGESSIEEYREAWEPKAKDMTTYVQIRSADDLAGLLVGATDAFTQAHAEAAAKPSAKRQLRAPAAAAKENADADAELVKTVSAATVIQDGEETDAPQAAPVSSGKAKLEALMAKNEKKAK